MWTWQLTERITEASPVPGFTGTVATLARGDGAPCAVMTDGLVRCVSTDAMTGDPVASVTLPALVSPSRVSVRRNEIYTVAVDGTPRAWRISGTRALAVQLPGVPNRVKALEPYDIGAYSLTADGVMQEHQFGNGIPSGTRVFARGARGCALRANTVRCPRGAAPRGFTPPAGTAVVTVEPGDSADGPGALPRLSDGRLVQFVRRTFHGPIAPEPVRGFGG